MPNKKSFILHIDSLSILDDLTCEQAGSLFKAIYAYHLGEDLELDPLTKIAFSPFKNQFVRDKKKYENVVKRNQNNGLKGGRPKTQTNPNKPTGLSGNPNKPKQTQTNPENLDSDSDSVSDSENESVSDKERIKPMSAKADAAVEIFTHWVEVMGKNPKSTKFTKERQAKVKARLKDGYTVEFIKQAIIGCSMSPHHMGDNKHRQIYDDLELICRYGKNVEGFNKTFQAKKNERHQLDAFLNAGKEKKWEVVIDGNTGQVVPIVSQATRKSLKSRGEEAFR